MINFNGPYNVYLVVSTNGTIYDKTYMSKARAYEIAKELNEWNKKVRAEGRWYPRACEMIPCDNQSDQY